MVEEQKIFDMGFDVESGKLVFKAGVSYKKAVGADIVIYVAPGDLLVELAKLTETEIDDSIAAAIKPAVAGLMEALDKKLEPKEPEAAK